MAFLSRLESIYHSFLLAGGIEFTQVSSPFEPISAICRRVISVLTTNFICRTWKGRKMHIRGKKNPDYELIKERNGPFAGKRVNHPVANYDECHTLAKNYLEAHLGKNASESLRY